MIKQYVLTEEEYINLCNELESAQLQLHRTISLLMHDTNSTTALQARVKIAEVHDRIKGILVKLGWAE